MIKIILKQKLKVENSLLNVIKLRQYVLGKNDNEKL